MQFPVSLAYPLGVVALTLRKTLIIGATLACTIFILSLSIQVPDLLTDVSGERAIVLASCVLYAMVQAWFWGRQLIEWQFEPGSKSYLAYDMTVRSFFLIDTPLIEPTSAYQRPIALSSNNDQWLILLPSGRLRAIGTIYALLVPYSYFLVLSKNTSIDALDFVFIALNVIAALYVAYWGWNVLSRWYWDVRSVEHRTMEEIYEGRRGLRGSASGKSLIRFLLGRWASVPLLILTALPVGMVAISARQPGELAHHIGTEGIFFLALGSMIAIGSLVALALMAMRLPPLLGALGWLVLVRIAAPADHTVAAKGFLAAGAQDSRKDVKEEICEWLAHNGIATRWVAKDRTCQLGGASPEKELPIIFISASGGGLRAAYWTGSVLGALSDCIAGFDSAVFSISAVSGGSLGVAVHGIGRTSIPAKARVCDLGRGDAATAGADGSALSVRGFAADVLGQDFLAPTTERLLFGDLFASFFPFPVLGAVRVADRGDALREGWTQSVREACRQRALSCAGREALARPLLAWREGRDWSPVVVFNSTHLETGARFLHSTTKIASDALDFHDVAQGDLALGDAVLNSARFPIVSPAGRLEVQGKEKGSGASRGHLIDGGYFDNSGARTTYEIAREVLAVADALGVRLKPLFLNLENDPAFWDVVRNSRHVAESYFRTGAHDITQAEAVRILLKERVSDARASEERTAESRSGLQLSGAGIFHELMAGVEGLLSTWTSHRASVQQERAVQHPGSSEVNLRLCPGPEHSPTLAWKLGKGNRTVIEQVLLSRPPLKPMPDAIMAIFNVERAYVSPEELKELASQGAPGRMEARERAQRYDAAVARYHEIDEQYTKLFGKHTYGEGFGRSDMLGRALTLNLCHNAVHEGVERIAGALH